jgi:hypothetical protein
MAARSCFLALLLLGLLVAPVAGQTPTPDPTPTPSVIDGSSGQFVVVPSVSYGQGGVILGLLLVAGLLLIQIGLEVAQWIKQ